MNIFLRELKANLKSLLIWGGIAILFVTVGFSKFQAFYGNPEMLAMLDGMPPALLAAFNMKVFNLTTVTGFQGLMFSYFTLILSIAAVIWGTDIITKEERDKTVEFALTLPVTRNRVVTAKTLAALVNCIGLLLITWGIILINASKYQPDREYFKFLALSMLALFILEMIFLSIGIFLGCVMKQYKRASSVAVSLILGAYFIYIITGVNMGLDFLKYFSPFKYFNPATLLRESRIDLAFLWVSIGIIVVCMVGAYISYSRRDLYI